MYQHTETNFGLSDLKCSVSVRLEIISMPLILLHMITEQITFEKLTV